MNGEMKMAVETTMRSVNVVDCSSKRHYVTLVLLVNNTINCIKSI